MTPLVTLTAPAAVVYGNFLSAIECMGLIACAGDTMQRSRVIDRSTGKPAASEARTSSVTFLKRGQNELVECIEKRISNLTGFPVENGEGIQILRYEVGEEYRKHYDYFNPERETSLQHTKRGGQRIATFLMYLSTPGGGGETMFPQVGVSVHANEGNALFFQYPTPTPSTKTLHCGVPVTKGVKWVATKWIRESKFA